MASHIECMHANECDRGQLDILLEVSEGPVDESLSQPCVFCSIELPIKRLLEHIAGHLEELAIFVMPNDAGSDPAAEESSGILSSLDSVDDDISIPDVGYVNPMDVIVPTGNTERLRYLDTEDPSPIDTPNPVSAEVPISSISGHTAEESRTGLSAPPPSGTYECEECGRAFDQIHKLK